MVDRYVGPRGVLGELVATPLADALPEMVGLRGELKQLEGKLERGEATKEEVQTKRDQLARRRQELLGSPEFAKIFMDEKKILTELAPYVGWRINVDGPPKLEKGPRTDTPTTPHPSLAPRMRERFRDFMLFEQAIIVNLPEERQQEVFYKLNPKHIETTPGAPAYGGPFFYLDRVEFGTDRYDVKMSPLLEKALYEEKDPKVPYNYFLQEVGSWAVEEAKRALAAAREAGNRAAIEDAEAKLKQEQDEANAAKEAAPARRRRQRRRRWRNGKNSKKVLKNEWISGGSGGRRTRLLLRRTRLLLRRTRRRSGGRRPGPSRLLLPLLLLLRRREPGKRRG